jgi:predicted nucleic acid-binding protein
VILYAESSAVLAWLLNEPEGEPVRLTLAGATRIVASRLTLVECSRALNRARMRGRLDEAGALAASRLLDEAVSGWVVMDLVGEVMTRAARPLPLEPARTLDALHLASAFVYHHWLGAVAMLSLDQRIRGNASALGLAISPA